MDDTPVDPGELIDAAERRRHGWYLLLLGIVLLVLAVSVPVLLRSPAARSDAEDPVVPLTSTTLMSASTRAAVYAAALTGESRPHRLTRPVVVDVRECTGIAVTAQLRCTGRRLPDAVRTAIVTTLGPGVVFRADPPPPRSDADPPVIRFGRLRARPADAGAVLLPMQTGCGPGCGQGQTLVLHRHRRGWVVTGTTGPQWIA